MRPLKIRRLCIDDYPRLIKLWEQAKLPYRPKGRDKRKNIGQQIKQPNTIYLVAELNKKIVGSILGTHDSRKGYINRLAVLSEYQNQGIGRRLVKAVEKYMEHLGIKIITCLVEDWNKTSLKAFQRLGYKKHKDIIYFSKRKSAHI
jgi:ribosomal protein S18 acetylase RimI-like enzyme